MPKFLSPIDHSNLELINALLQNLPTISLPGTNRGGQIVFDTTLNLPAWNSGSGFNYIYKPSTSHVASTITAVIRDTSGDFSANIITAALAGNASTATKLLNLRNIGISGNKVTATAASFDGSAAVDINVTALSVAAGDISLTNGSFIVGNGSAVGAATAKSAIPLSGFGAAGADVAMGGFKITGLADPTNAQDAATKAYVDSLSAGLDPKDSCRLATYSALAATYTTGNQRLTGTSNGSLTVDGVLVVSGNRILVRAQSTASQNGVYVVTQVGDGYTPFILTRAPDFNTSAKASPGSFVFIEEGVSWSDTGWVMSSDAAITLDTSNINWVQFSGAGSYTAGRGLVQAGSVFHFAQTTAYTVGDIFYASNASSIAPLAAAAANNALISNGAAAAPSWGKIGLSTHVSGILPIANGGTGLSSSTTNGLLYGGASTMGQTAAPASGQIVVGSASGVPTFVSMSADATITAAGALTIAANAVSYAKFQQIAGLSVVGNSTATTANGAAITGTANQVLRVDSTGTALGFGAINLANGNAVTGILPGANGGTGTQYAQFTTGGSTLRTYSLTDRNAALAATVSGTIAGNGSTTVFSATHNLNTKMVLAAVYDSNDDQIFVDTKTFDVNNVRFTFAVAPANAAAYRWVVIGY